MIASVPVELGRDEAARLAREELAKQVYRDAGPGLVERLVRWLLEEAGKLLDGAAGVSPGGYSGLVVVLLLVAAGGASGTVRSRVVPTADDTGVFPAAREVAGELLARAKEGDRVIATAPSDLPLAYYLAPNGKGRALLHATPDSAQRIWVVVNEAESQDVNVLLRRAEIMTIDFSPPRAAWRGAQARIFVIERERPGCRLAPERCR